MASGTIKVPAPMLQTMFVDGTTDADGDLTTGLSTTDYSLVCCSPIRGLPEPYYQLFYFCWAYSRDVNGNYMLKCVMDQMTALGSKKVRVRIDYMKITP